MKWLLGPLTADEALLDNSVPSIRNRSNLTVISSFDHRFEYGQDLATPSPYWGSVESNGSVEMRSGDAWWRRRKGMTRR
jgi:hypothetical protein